MYRWYKNGVLNATTLADQTDMVAYYPFNDDSKDYVGDNDGTQVGGVTLQSSGGKVGGAFDFDGSTGYIDLVSHLSDFEGLDQGSVSLWYKSADTSTDFEPLYSTTLGGGITNLNFLSVGSGIGAFASESILYSLRRDGVSPPNNDRLQMVVDEGLTKFKDQEWHHLVLITGDGNNRFITDGVVKTPSFARGNAATNEFSNINSPNRLRIGSYHVSSTTNVYGSIDEFMFFNRSITNEEARQLYYGGFGGGTVLNSSLTSDGDEWTFSVQSYNATDSGTEIFSDVSTISGPPPAPAQVYIVEGSSVDAVK